MSPLLLPTLTLTVKFSSLSVTEMPVAKSLSVGCTWTLSYLTVMEASGIDGALVMCLSPTSTLVFSIFMPLPESGFSTTEDGDTVPTSSVFPFQVKSSAHAVRQPSVRISASNSASSFLVFFMVFPLLRAARTYFVPIILPLPMTFCQYFLNREYRLFCGVLRAAGKFPCLSIAMGRWPQAGGAPWTTRCRQPFAQEAPHPSLRGYFPTAAGKLLARKGLPRIARQPRGSMFANPYFASM